MPFALYWVEALREDDAKQSAGLCFTFGGLEELLSLAIYSRAGDGNEESIVKSFTTTALLSNKAKERQSVVKPVRIPRITQGEE